jgi:integrase
MCGVQKKGKYYYWYYDLQGKRYSGGDRFPNAKDAQRAGELNKEKRRKHNIERRTITLKQYAIEYFNYAKNYLKRSTLEGLRSLLKNHILDKSISAIRLDKLRPGDIKEFINTYSNKNTAKTVLKILRRILKNACYDEIIEFNPAESVRMPKAENKEREIPSVEQVRNLLLDESLDLKDRVILALGGVLGLRNSEIFGLLWANVSFSDQTLKIDRQNHKGYITTLKTPGSEKTCSISPKNVGFLYDLLRDYRKQNMAEKWLFPSKRNNEKPMHSTNWYIPFFKYLRESGRIPKTSVMHGFRKFSGSYLISRGATIPEVQKHLRHSNPETTMRIYVRALAGGKDTTEYWRDFIDKNVEESVEKL